MCQSQPNEWYWVSHASLFVSQYYCSVSVTRYVCHPMVCSISFNVDSVTSILGKYCCRLSICSMGLDVDRSFSSPERISVI